MVMNLHMKQFLSIIDCNKKSRRWVRRIKFLFHVYLIAAIFLISVALSAFSYMRFERFERIWQSGWWSRRWACGNSNLLTWTATRGSFLGSSHVTVFACPTTSSSTALSYTFKYRVSRLFYAQHNPVAYPCKDVKFFG